MEQYYFTFMSSQGVLANRYLKVEGNYDEARNKVFAAIGGKWAFQYSAKEFAGQAERFGLTEVSLKDAADIMKVLI